MPVGDCSKDAGETVFEGAAVDKFVDDLRDGRTQRPVTGLIVIWVTGEEGGKVAVGALPECRFAGIACPLDVHVPETESNLNVPVLWDTRHQSRLHAGVRLMAPRESLRRRAAAVWRQRLQEGTGARSLVELDLSGMNEG